MLVCGRRLARGLSSLPAGLPRPRPDWSAVQRPAGAALMQRNIELRKSQASVVRVQELCRELQQVEGGPDQQRLEQELLAAALALPNICPDSVLALGTENKIIHERPFTKPDFKLRTFEDVARILSGARLSNLGLLAGERSYFLSGPLAELEAALVQWTVDSLLGRGFSLLSVPDILHPAVIEACGMRAEGERTQVYRLAGSESALSGTAEMAIGGLLAGARPPRLPLKLAAVSRCYRAETGGAKEEGGLYRVHQVTKVEMFVVTEGGLEQSEAALEEVLGLQRELFDSLGLAHRVLAMCPEELGDPAYTKFDIEAWLPGRAGGYWGEISSCSNCTDYQSRRLGITSAPDQFCHTVNGTACAVPRMIIAICEQFQRDAGGSVAVPAPLVPYLRGQTALEPLPKRRRPQLQWIPGANYLQGRE
jgi:seryl-tRNA synthetase